MKFTAEDFKDRLAGGQDKHEAVEDIKFALTTLMQYKCKVARRKTAKGHKIYFTIEPLEGYEPPGNAWWKESLEYIKTHFPDANLTSGGSSSWTIAEYR